MSSLIVCDLEFQAKVRCCDGKKYHRIRWCTRNIMVYGFNKHKNEEILRNLGRWKANFPWDDYCFYVRDPSLCAERITEVIVSGIESYIPHTFSNTKAKKPWFNSACSCAINDREAAHNRYCSHPPAETHALYISSHNYTKPILQLNKNSFINRKC